MPPRHHYSAGPQRRRPTYMHELDDWPNFRWDEEVVAPSLEHARRQQVDIAAYAAALGNQAAAETTVRNLTDSAVTTSQIEGEYPDPKAVEATIRRRIVGGPPTAGQGERDEPGIAIVTADTAANYTTPLTSERLHGWHRLLFSAPSTRDITVGRWRDDHLSRMRVVSRHPTGRTIIHFETPTADRLDDEMNHFLEWFNQPEDEPDLIKAAIAHLWFVTIHPYDDGNGRIARAITDLALSRCDGTDTHSYSMSAEILRQRAHYYQAKEISLLGI